ncbi:hypothetical protein G3I31_33605, partial [Streptomyces sp. SID9913]|nr:hypothetical protein [Streptomyces sp. SID9913]
DAIVQTGSPTTPAAAIRRAAATAAGEVYQVVVGPVAAGGLVAGAGEADGATEAEGEAGVDGVAEDAVGRPTAPAAGARHRGRAG